MKNADEIRQLTLDLRIFMRSLQNFDGLTELAMGYEAKTDEILDLLPCKTCNGARFSARHGSTPEPCPDCKLTTKLQPPPPATQL